MRLKTLAWHGVALVVLLAVAGVLATWRGALWPFDLRATALMVTSGLAGLAFGWGPVWALPLGLAVALPQWRWRLALWPCALALMVLLHGLYGPARGFLALSVPERLGLYAVPVALVLLLGSALRTVLPFDRNQV